MWTRTSGYSWNSDFPVSLSLVRSTLNLPSDKPSDADLTELVRQATDLVQGKVAYEIVPAAWQYIWDASPGNLSAVLMRGFFYKGGGGEGFDQDPALAESDGSSVDDAVFRRIGSDGQEMVILEVDWDSLDYPVILTAYRGLGRSDIDRSQCPRDLQSAIVTACEQLILGYNVPAENAVNRVCRRYSWTNAL